MRSKLVEAVRGFYTNENELDITLFKLLGTGGIVVSLVGVIQDPITSSDFTGALINLGAAIASMLLMWFVHTTKKYVVGYLITSVSIFMFLFAWLFLETGGMNGSMPYFFSFGIVFTTLMYKGRLMYLMVLLQTLFYVAVSFLSYKYPQLVKEFQSPEKQFIDQMAGILFSAIGIGFIFIMYLREYRKQQKITEESSNAKSILLANISHEIRTPINMLMGMNEMILRESENTQISEYAGNIENAGQQLLFMVNQFLDLSRIDMGKEVLFEENFNLVSLAESLGAFFGKEAEKKGLEFVLDMDKGLPVYVFGDAKKLSQILSNLLSNAVKYTEKGTVVLSIHVNEKTPKGNNIHFEVSDTGSGISEKDQKRIFESFERADIIRNRSIEGTGLGLAISNKLADLMGSGIQVKSKYGVGSVFWFDLDLADGEENVVSAGKGGAFIAPEARILVVDDNNMNLMVVKSLLKRTFITVDTADSARQCYDRYRATHYDLVLMDYMMPEIDGIQAMEELRRIDRERHGTTPIIVLTADATPEKKELFMAKGFDDYLLKPIDSGLLENMLTKHLPGRLVTRVSSDEEAILSPKERSRFAELLKEYDISLERALKQLSGDILQYVRVSEFFARNSEENMAKIESAVKAGDLETVAVLVHALKGNAGNVGADDLFYSAKRMERRARDGDSEYIRTAFSLFMMKWRRVVKGIEAFRTEFEKIRPSLVNDKKEVGPVLDADAIKECLLKEVRLGNRSGALKFADDLESLSGKSETLTAVRESIMNIEFDKAEALIGEL